MNRRNTSKIIFLSAFVCFCFVFMGKAQASDIEKEIIDQVNQERASRGLIELEENELLDKAAFLKAQDMIGNDYFAHTSPIGINPWHWLEQVEYEYKYAGENLAMEFSSAVSVHRAWMKSKTHKENIVSDKYKEIGVAVIEGVVEGKETRVAVQFFGAPLNENRVISKIEEEKEIAEEKNEINMQEVSIRPWEGTSEDQMIIYAKLSGNPLDVEVQVGKESFPLEEVQEGKYMNLVSLSGVNLKDDIIVVKAQANELEALYFQVQKGVYAEYIPSEKEENDSDEVLSAVASINPTSLNMQERAINSQNVALAGFMLVCIILIGNVWILEKEEEKLLQACHS